MTLDERIAKLRTALLFARTFSGAPAVDPAAGARVQVLAAVAEALEALEQLADEQAQLRERIEQLQRRIGAS